MAEKIGLLKRICWLGKVALAVVLVLSVPIVVVGIVVMTDGLSAFFLSIGWVALAKIIGDKLGAYDSLKSLPIIVSPIGESHRWQDPRPPGWFILALMLMRLVLLAGLGLAHLLGFIAIVIKFDLLAFLLSIGWIILIVGWVILTVCLIYRITRSPPSTGT